MTPSGEEDLERWAARSGDTDAWQALVERYERLVFAVPKRLGLSDADAEEVAQNTWVTLFEHMRLVRSPERISSWLVTTASREAWRIARRREREVAGALDHLTSDPAPVPEEGLEDLELRGRIEATIETLPPSCRALIRKLFYEPTRPSYAEVARDLGMPVGSIGPTRVRCLAKLARLLEGPAADRANKPPAH